MLFGFRLVWVFGLDACLAWCILVLFVDWFSGCVGFDGCERILWCFTFGWCRFD